MEDAPEGGVEHGGDLEAAIAARRHRADAKSAQELQLEVEAARLRLIRRSQIIDAMRKAYVRDVVMIKNELTRKAAMTDEEYAAQGGPGTEVTDAIPSLDMRPVLALFSPEDAFLRVESCGGCGGHLEIVTRETKRVVKLNKRISALTAQMEESGKESAQLRAELMLTRQRVKELDDRNNVNRDTLVAKLELTQKTCEEDIISLQEEARRADSVWQVKLARKHEELEAVPVLEKEGDRLRASLAEEKAEREDDLHLKDGEIAMLKAKVEDLEASDNASTNMVIDVKNKRDDLQRRLKGEQSDHAATKGLLDEERLRYERCRAKLETSQEHLADLNDRFNEQRAEVESAAENAEEEAGEANDALAAAKVEIKRLRAVLGASDAAAALEVSNLKLSSLSEELQLARAEATQANDALREAQELAKSLQAQLGNPNSRGPSGSTISERNYSLDSGGGLSWHGSVVDLYDEGNVMERQDVMSSSKTPRDEYSEKGKWVVEKWLALVKFRKAVDLHNAEVYRLQVLLDSAQADEDRVRLTTDLEAASDQQELVDMEHSMHMEIAALKQRAAGSSTGQSGQSEGIIIASAPGGEHLERTAAQLAEQDKANKAQQALLEEKIVQLESEHQQALEALRLELDSSNERIGVLEAEAEDMREKVKRLAKLENHQKRHGAMNEELKKMETETGISVGFDSSLEIASVDGDLSREDEARLIEELERAKEEIKNMKTRQAMVTHELLGNIKGATAEIEMLRAQLAQAIQERDERLDFTALAGMGRGISGAEAEELETLKEEMKLQKKATEVFKQESRECSSALETLIKDLSRACKETRRAKAKVWNLRDLERARCIPPPPLPTGATNGGKVSASIRRLSVASAARRKNSMKGQTLADNKAHTKNVAGEEGSGSNKEVAVDGEGVVEDKEVELGRRREAREAQALAKQLEREAEDKEREELEEACASPQSDGVQFAAERLEAFHANIKEQFKEVFTELKEALEMHKKFVLRTRVEARERVTRTASLEADLERITALLKSTEQELRGRSAVLRQTEVNLNAEKDAVAGLQRDFEASQKKARDNFYFKEKNASLQKKLDHAEIFSRGAKQECAKAKWELQEQAAILAELRKCATETDKREENLKVAEVDLKAQMAALAKTLEETEHKLDEIDEQRKRKLEGLTSASSQVNGYGDPDLGAGHTAHTQTEFHCPQLTLRRSNNVGGFPTRASNAGSESGSRFSPAEGISWTGVRGAPRAGIVCPAVDGKALAAERDILCSPGVGSAAFLETQSCGTLYTSGTTLDNNSPSITQLSYRTMASATDVVSAQHGVEYDNMHQNTGNGPESDVRSSSEKGQWSLWSDSERPEDFATLDATKNQRRRPHTTSDICPGMQMGGTGKGLWDDAEEQRPQTSPSLAHAGFSERSAQTVGVTSPPPRMQSRLFLQSAMDLSRSSRCWGGAGLSPKDIVTDRPSAALPREERTPLGAAKRPSTSSAVIDLSRARRYIAQEGLPNDGGVTVSQGRAFVPMRAGDGRKARVSHIIDLGVVADVPRPRVWDDQQMAAAAAAATGKKSVPFGRRGCGGGVVMSRGGVVVDARLANVRKTLRRELLDAAERAKLPLLQ